MGRAKGGVWVLERSGSFRAPFGVMDAKSLPPWMRRGFLVRRAERLGSLSLSIRKGGAAEKGGCGPLRCDRESG